MTLSTLCRFVTYRVQKLLGICKLQLTIAKKVFITSYNCELCMLALNQSSKKSAMAVPSWIAVVGFLTTTIANL
jgi:hypothetical protein